MCPSDDQIFGPKSLAKDEFDLNVALRPQRPYGLLGTGSPGWPPRLSRRSWTLHERGTRSTLRSYHRSAIKTLC